MKSREFREQLGYSPDEFSNALPLSNDAEAAQELRARSVASVDPFMPPQYFDQPPVQRGESQPYDADPEELVENDPTDEEDVPTEEVGWVILPPGEGSERGPNSGEGGRGRYAIEEDDPENIKRLKRLVRAWGPHSRIAVSRVEASDGTKYQVAVLPVVIGGLAVEHALADTSADRNSMLGWRAEKGMSEDGEVVTTWREVFSGDKERARAMGARFMYHTDTLDERIATYFARPADEIDKPW